MGKYGRYGYLRTADITKLLCTDNNFIYHLVRRRKLVEPTFLDDPADMRPGKRWFFTQKQLREIGKILYREMYTKQFKIKCPKCRLPRIITLSDLILNELESEGIKINM